MSGNKLVELIPYTSSYLKLNLPLTTSFRSDKAYDRLLVSFLDEQAVYATVNVHSDGISVVEGRMDVRGRHISPNVWLNSSSDRVVLVWSNEVVEEYRNASIVSHVFNPHVRVGACILRERRFTSRRTLIVHGFYDNSYNVLRVNEGVLGFNPEGVLLAYIDKKKLVVELPPSRGILIEVSPREVKGLKEVYMLDGLVFLNHLMGLTVFRDNKVVVHVRNINLIPILVLEDSIVFWDQASSGIAYLRDNSIRYSTLCSSKPYVVKYDSEEVLLACGKSIIQLNVRNGLWRLHSVVKSLLGINYRHIDIIGDIFVVDTSDGILLISADGRTRGYYSIKNLLGIDTLKDKIIAYTTEALLVIDPSRYYDVDSILDYEVISGDDVYPKIRVRVAEGIVVDNMEYSDSLKLIKRSDRELLFTYDSRENLWITLKPLSLKPVKIELKPPKPEPIVRIKNIDVRNSSKCGGGAISLRYYYINPNDKVIHAPILIDNRVMEYIVLEPHSRGLEQVEICIPSTIGDELLVKLRVDGSNVFEHLVRLKSNKQGGGRRRVSIKGFTVIDRKAYLKIAVNNCVSYDNLLVKGILESSGKPIVKRGTLLVPVTPGKGWGLTVLLGCNGLNDYMVYNIPVLVQNSILRIIPTYCIDKNCYIIISVGRRGYLLVFAGKELVYNGFSGRGNILVRLSLDDGIVHAYLYSNEEIYHYHVAVVSRDDKVRVSVDLNDELVHIGIYNPGAHDIIASFNNAYYSIDGNSGLLLRYDLDTFMSINTPLSIIGSGFYYDVDVKNLLVRKLLYKAVRSASLISGILMQ